MFGLRMRSRRWAATLMLAAWPLAAAALDPVCYGTLDGNCTPPDLGVAQTALIELPGNINVASREDRQTLNLTLPEGVSWARQPVALGDTQVLVFNASTYIVAVSARTLTVSGLAVEGAFEAGDDVTMRVRLFNPNTSALLYDSSLTVATVNGVRDGWLWFANPAGSNEPTTFARLINTGDREAFVRLRPVDDAGRPGGEMQLLLAGGESVQLNSTDLEAGNADKGIIGAFGRPSAGKWRIRVISDQCITALGMVRNAEAAGPSTPFVLSALDSPCRRVE